MTDPGDQPIAFKLSYPMAAVTEGTPYRLYAGVTEGDLAWVTPIGVAVSVPQNPEITGVELPLQYRPDLLKGAVTGTISGDGLDGITNPDAYGTALVLRVDTGETIGIQMISPFDMAPADFSVPYDPTTIDPDADYVARASVWDGTGMWVADGDMPVITKGNPQSGVSLSVSAPPVPTPTPAPTASPSAQPTPTPTPDPDTTGDTGGFSWIALLVVAALAVIGIGAAMAWQRSRQAPEDGNPQPDPTPGPVPPMAPIDDVAGVDAESTFAEPAAADAPADPPVDDLDADLPPAEGPADPDAAATATADEPAITDAAVDADAAADAVPGASGEGLGDLVAGPASTDTPSADNGEDAGKR